MPSILFLCVYNACRSRMAEAICARLAPAWDVASAGLTPSLKEDPKAAATLARHGLAMRPGAPQGLDRLPQRRWDFVIDMSGQGPQTLETALYLVWPVPDPHDGPVEEYEALYERLKRSISGLIHAG